MMIEMDMGGDDCQACDEMSNYLDVVSRTARKIADAIPQHPSPPPTEGNLCKLSMFSLPDFLIANLDPASIAMALQALHDASDNAGFIDW